MIRGLILVFYLLIRFLYGDLRLGWWKLCNPNSGHRLHEKASDFMRLEGRRIIHSAEIITGFSIFTESALTELPSRFALVSNHQSLLDIPALIAALPKRNLKFIAKRSLKYGVPLVSKVLRYGGDALIKRPRGRMDASEIRTLLHELRRFSTLSGEGICPVIFADGSRSRDGIVHRFYTGGLATVIEQQPLPIVTVAIDGGYRLRGLFGLARMGRTRYRVKFLSVHQPPHTKRELRALVQKTHKEISAQIEHWRHETLPLTPDLLPSDDSPHRTGNLQTRLPEPLRQRR